MVELKANKSKGTWIDKITDRIFRGLIWLALCIPYEQRVPFMGWLIKRVIGPLAGYRKRAIESLTYIMTDLSVKEIQDIADGVLDNLGRTIIENYSGIDFSKRIEKATVYCDGFSAVETAVAEGRPIIFVTGHFGNHEAPRQWLNTKGFRIGGLYRPMKNPYFNEHYARTMTEMSGPVFPQGRQGTTGFIRHIKNGGLATLLFDVHAHDAPKINFMGHLACTATSAAEMALKFDAVMIPYFAKRKKNGLDFEIYIEAPIEPSNPVTMLTEATKRLERHIHSAPEQWFWVHRRWKPQRTQDAARIDPGPTS